MHETLTRRVLVQLESSWTDRSRFCPAFFQANVPSLTDAIANVKTIPARMGWALALRSKGIVTLMQHYHDPQS